MSSCDENYAKHIPVQLLSIADHLLRPIVNLSYTAHTHDALDTPDACNVHDTHESDIPETDIPETDMPETDMPETNMPKTDMLETNMPETDMPETDMPETDMPETDMPETDMPETATYETCVMYDVHYYLFHNRVSDMRIERLRAYSETLGISFHEILIEDVNPYIQIASKGGGWCYEAYFSLECHQYLPLDVDRILYIDAADVLILGDIGEFYFTDFDDYSLLVTCARYKSSAFNGNSVYTREDLGVDITRKGILRGIFNSGSYVINVDKLRREKMSINDYLYLVHVLSDIYPEEDRIYFGDQGLLSATFVGDVKYFAYPTIRNIWYQPYNFCMWFFDRSTETTGKNPWYVPKIIHFAASIKPWKLNIYNERYLKPGQWSFYKIYQMYANQTRYNQALYNYT